MCSLSTFQPPPPSGYITMGEQHGDLIAVHADEAGKSMLTQNLNYPAVVISHELMKPTLTRETARSAFLEHNETLHKRLLHAWYEYGLSGLLQETASGSSLLSACSTKLLHGLRWISKLHGSIFPRYTMSSEDLISEYSLNINWMSTGVRCFAWHPHVTKFAIALRDDSIHVYTSHKQDIIPILKHKLQKQVSAIVWKPLSASILAVACQSCVLIWQVDPTSLASRPSSSTVQVLRHSKHRPVTSLVWDPRGGVLITGSPVDSSIMVWDVATERHVSLRRVEGGGITQISWSPDGSKLFCAAPAAMFRVWETQHWQSEHWSKLHGRCQTGCWSPDGSVLLFSTTEEPIIYSLTFGKGVDGTQSVIGGSKAAIVSADLSQVDIETDDGLIRVGGRIQQLAWDPSGERLAVQFKDSGSHLIALFQTRMQPIFEIIPCGFIQGHPGDTPTHICFQPNFESGALLTVVWSSGHISYIPLYFLRRDFVEDQRIPVDHQHSINTTMPDTMCYSLQRD